MANIILLDVGDYSFDGHGRNLAYRVSIDKDVEAARAAHNCVTDQTGIDLHGFCDDPEDHRIPNDVVEKLTQLGFKFPPHRVEDGVHYMDGEECAEDLPDLMAQIWVFLLNHVDPALNAAIVPDEDEPPHLLVPGQGFHSVGYGLV